MNDRVARPTSPKRPDMVPRVDSLADKPESRVCLHLGTAGRQPIRLISRKDSPATIADATPIHRTFYGSMQGQPSVKPPNMRVSFYRCLELPADASRAAPLAPLPMAATHQRRTLWR